MSGIVDPDVLGAMMRISTPIVLAAMGGLLCMRAAVFNIALEGFMLVGAFSAIYVAHLTASVPIGIVGAMCAGMATSVIFGSAVLRFRADVIIASIAINLLALGGTAFLLRTLLGSSGVFRPTGLDPLPPLTIPLIDDVPVLGALLSGHTPLVYGSLIIVALTYFVLFRTSFGLAVRSVGEAPNAVKTAGLDPDRIRMATIIWSGALCGLAGAHLSTGYVFEFSENMVQGRGYTAFTAIVFGLEHPIWTFLASLVFALAEAFGIRMQLADIGVPPSILNTFPYIFAIVVLTLGSALRQRRLGYQGT